MGWVGNFRVTSAPRYHTHVSRLVPRYSPIPKPFGCGCALEYLFLCTSEHFHFHFHFQGSLHHPRQLHPTTLSPQPTSAQGCILIAMALSSLSSPRCLWYWMLRSSSSVWSIHHTSINQFGYLCGASYPSYQPLLPLISFEVRGTAKSFNAVFSHSRHTSNFLICFGYHQNNISISKKNYPRHILISKNLFGHWYHVVQPDTQLGSPIIFHPRRPRGPRFILQHLFNSTPATPVYLWQKVSQYSGCAPPFFFLCSPIGSWFHDPCWILWHQKTCQQQNSLWHSNNPASEHSTCITALVKLIIFCFPAYEGSPLNCHVEILIGLSAYEYASPFLSEFWR